jgi:Calcineurin-like phosphoesterase
MPNILGLHGRLFADPRPEPDATQFQVDNTSEEYYRSPYYLRHKDQLQPVPSPSVVPPRLALEQVLDTDILNPIRAAKRITFHSVGDTGAAKVNAFQTATKALENEESVTDGMARDVQAGGPDAPAFFFHLGDIIYNFGEGQYYYDQFYAPFRAYDRPIFAIPGNHDGAVFGPTPDVPQVPTLTAYLRNFCANTPGPAADAAGIMRSAMTQPGPYFTLDAPFVSIIGLYTNVLEGPGVISSQGGQYPIGDDQLTFLIEELVRLKPQQDSGEIAVILACHHPPVSVDSNHAGWTGLATDIDKACQQAQLWPDAVLSGHAHLYQRFTRAGQGKEIPYVVAGSGGFSATPPQGGLPRTPLTIGEYTLEQPPIVNFGYLSVTIDVGSSPPTLNIKFKCRDPSVSDSVTVNLMTHQLISPASA